MKTVADEDARKDGGTASEYAAIRGVTPALQGVDTRGAEVAI